MLVDLAYSCRSAGGCLKVGAGLKDGFGGGL